MRKDDSDEEHMNRDMVKRVMSGLGLAIQVRREKEDMDDMTSKIIWFRDYANY